MLRFTLVALLTIVLLVGAYIRVQPILAGDTLFQFDHGRDLWDVKKIVYDGDFTLIGPDTGLHGVFNGPYHYYLLALPMWLSDGHPLAGSYFNSLLHILAIYLCFELGRRMVEGSSKIQTLQAQNKLQFPNGAHEDPNKLQKKSKFENYSNSHDNKMPAMLFGLLVATIYAFARGGVSATVFFWNPNWIPALMVPWVFGMWMGVMRKSGWGLVVAGFFGGIAANVEVAYGVFLIPVYVVMVSLLWPGVWKRVWSWLGLVAFGVHFLPHLIFDLRNDFLMSRAIIGLLSGNNVSLGRSIAWPDRLWVRGMELYAVTGGNLSADENKVWGYWLTTLVFIGVLLLVIPAKAGIHVRLIAKIRMDSGLRRNDNIREVLFFLLPFVVYYLCFLVYPRVAWPWYWVGLQTVFYFLCAYVVWRAVMVGRFVRYFALGGMAFWLVITMPYYFKEPTFLEQEPGRFSNMLRVVDSVFEDAKDEQFAVYTYTPPIRDHAFGYIFWWRGRTEHDYVPYTAYALRDGEAIPETVYLVIDPPCASYDTAISCEAKSVQLKGWLETSTPKGMTVWERDYPGRLRVVKRQLTTGKI